MEQPIYQFSKIAPNRVEPFCPTCGSDMAQIFSVTPPIGWTGIYRCVDRGEIGCDVWLDPTFKDESL